LLFPRRKAGWAKAVLRHYRPVLNGELYFSGEEVCTLLHISKRTLQQYRDDGLLPYIQIGGKIIFRQSDIVRILEQNYNGALNSEASTKG
jgi:excisionase family DNA binding protein